ncbi:MAG: SBBP repeat-containing protein, partial [Cyclobacteriaceae bacterium]
MNKKGLLILALCSYIFQLHGGPGTGFIENKNQWPCEVDFLADIPGGQMAISAGQFNYFFLDYGKVQQLHEASHHEFNEVNPSEAVDQPIAGRKVTVSFINSNSFAKPKVLGRSEVYYNYFFGSEPSRWGSRAYQYKEILYQDFYNGIDLKLTTSGSNLKYDLIVDPGVDPATIQLRYEGAGHVYVSNGDLIVDAVLAEIIEKKPIAYQIIEGEKKWVSIEYLLIDGTVSFLFPEGYDPCVELVIDPLLIFSTYSGSQADNWGSTATPGEKGYLYSSGVTNHFVGQAFSGTFLATPGAFQTSYGGLYDVAILKYDSIGQNLLYASYLGGSQSESPHSLVIDKDENLLIFGTTSSNNFPVTAGAYDETYNNVGNDTVTHVVSYFKGSDIFVSKISKDGSQLLASTFLGGSKQDGVIASASVLVQNYGDQLRGDIISDENGDIFLSTVTSSNTDFPAINSFSTTYNGGGTDAVVVKLNASLSQILWSAYVGGAGSDAAYSIKFDSNGKLFLAGGTTSTNFPTATDAYQESFAGTVDGWIAKLEPDGSSIIAATYTGTSAYDQIYFLDLNSNDEVYVYGQTAGPVPVTPGVYSNPNSGQFLQKFDNDLSNLMLSTVFGRGKGKPDISPTAFLVN